MTKICGYRVHNAARLFPLMVGPEFDAFCENIQEEGLSEAVVLYEGAVLDGRNRLQACEKTGIPPRFTNYEGTDPYGYVVSHNLHRRHLGEGQRSMLGAQLKDILAAEAKERQRAGGRKGGQAAGQVDEASGPQPSPRGPQARDQAARVVNVSGRSVQRAAKVLERGTKELAAAVYAGLVSVDLAAQIADMSLTEQQDVVRLIEANPKKNAKAVVRQHSRDTVSARIDAEADMPEGPFHVLFVDFPWAYAKRSQDGTQRGQTPYPTMTAGEIELFAAEKLAPLAHQDAILFLCITNAHLVAGDHVGALKASGFTGKTMISWDKERMGTGDWLRGQTEHVIVATKGSPTVRLTNQTTVLQIPAMISEKRREHSQKPEEIYRLIESLCPGNKVELFSRLDRQGWTTWGAEAGSLGSRLRT